MNVSLSPEMRKFVEDRVSAGDYASPEEVIRAGLASLMQRERLARLPVDDLEAAFPGLREKISTGLKEADAGNVADGEAFFDRLEREDETPGAGRKTA
jgi:antitoxin ParD1/3/4